MLDPIPLISTHGFLFKLGDNIIRFGKSSSDLRTHAYQDIVMKEKHIVDLHDPVNVQDAATKNYVDTALPTLKIWQLRITLKLTPILFKNVTLDIYQI